MFGCKRKAMYFLIECEQPLGHEDRERGKERTLKEEKRERRKKKKKRKGMGH